MRGAKPTPEGPLGGLSDRAGSALLVALWLGHAAANFAWLKADTRPPYWDTAGHAMTALQISRLPWLGNFWGAIRAALTMSFYPPFVYLAAAPLGALLWPTVDVFTAVNTLFLGLLLLAVYRIGRSMAGPAGGLLAACVVSLYPIIYGLSRQFLLDVPLTALAALSVWLSLELVARGDWGRAAALGITLGLGLLTKWTFALFLAGPLLVAVAHALTGHRRGILVRLGLALAIAGALGAPWYVTNLDSQLATLRALNTTGYPVVEGDPALGTWAAWTYYPDQMVANQLFLPLTLFLCVAVGVLLWNASRIRVPAPAFPVLVTWPVAGYLAFTWVFNKDARFTMPILPALALLTALGLMRLRGTLLRRGLIGLLIAIALVQFVGLTWGLSGRLPAGVLPRRLDLRIGGHPLTVYAENAHIATPANAEDWQAQRILSDILETERAQGRTREVALTVLADAMYFEPNVFMYFALVDRLPVRVVRVTGLLPVTDAITQALASDYVVTKTGDQGLSWALQEAPTYREQLRDPTTPLGLRFQLIGAYPLPDGSQAELYARRLAD